MELDERKLRILNAIIDEYISSASPVGSRSISRRHDFTLSSATIRNEMADLEELGYLEQPHTSAGRIPSDKAYRLYVDRIVKRAQLSEQEIRFLRSRIFTKTNELEDLVRQTAKAISAVTQYTAIVMPPLLTADRLRHIQLVPLTVGKALVVVVTDAGFSKDAVIRIPEELTAQDLERLSRMLSERFYDCPMDRLSDRLTGELSGDLAERRDFLSGLMDTLERKMSGEGIRVETSGVTNMLAYPEYADMNKAKTFLSAIESRDSLYDLLRAVPQVEFTFTIGRENDRLEWQDCSIVTATYSVGGSATGTIGVIGPTRMQYGKVMSVLEFIKKGLGEMLAGESEEE